ncbi:MAG: tripartite tricarboxylate transporter permease [Candidatus Micrarchaeota archaeon]
MFDVLFGLLLGLLSGVLPGIHTNTIVALLMRSGMGTVSLLTTIVVLACARVVFELVQAVFLAIPDETTVVSVLPGHRLLLEGRGFYALSLCVLASLLALVFTVVLLPVSFFLFPLVFNIIEPFMLYALVIISILLLASERGMLRIAKAGLVFFLAGALGFVVLTFPVVREPLFPSFSGLFALSSMLIAARGGVSIPKQRDRWVEINVRGILFYVFIGVLLGLFADLFPGVSSPAQVAILASVFLFLDAPKFLATTSAIAVSHTIYSFVSIWTIGKARTGAAVAVRDLVGGMGAEWVFYIIALAVVGIAVASVLTLILGRPILKLISGADARKLNITLILYLLALVFVIEGARGIMVAAVATSIGVLPPMLGVRRTHLMGLILVPVILNASGMFLYNAW